MHRALVLAWAIGAVGLVPTSTGAADYVAVQFALDPVSMISFGDKQYLPLGGGSLTLRCYPSGTDDALAVRVAPRDLATKTLTIDGSKLSAKLAAPAKGFLQRRAGGEISAELEAVFRITSRGPDGEVSQDLPIRFTTESLEAFDVEGTQKLEVSGSRATKTGRVLQLVGKTTMSEGAGSFAGAAVYIVLSGTLSEIPSF